MGGAGGNLVLAARLLVRARICGPCKKIAELTLVRSDQAVDGRDASRSGGGASQRNPYSLEERTIFGNVAPSLLTRGLLKDYIGLVAYNPPIIIFNRVVQFVASCLNFQKDMGC